MAPKIDWQGTWPLEPYCDKCNILVHSDFFGVWVPVEGGGWRMLAPEEERPYRDKYNEEYREERRKHREECKGGA